jgi:hypothetical protein
MRHVCFFTLPLNRYTKKKDRSMLEECFLKRLTIALCANMAGDKEPELAIGNAY